MFQEQESYRVTTKLLTKAKEKMVVMHPLPRLNEIRYSRLRNAGFLYVTSMRQYVGRSSYGLSGFYMEVLSTEAVRLDAR